MVFCYSRPHQEICLRTHLKGRLTAWLQVNENNSVNSLQRPLGCLWTPIYLWVGCLILKQVTIRVSEREWERWHVVTALDKSLDNAALEM